MNNLFPVFLVIILLFVLGVPKIPSCPFCVKQDEARRSKAFPCRHFHDNAHSFLLPAYRRWEEDERNICGCFTTHGKPVARHTTAETMAARPAHATSNANETKK